MMPGDLVNQPVEDFLSGSPGICGAVRDIRMIVLQQLFPLLHLAPEIRSGLQPVRDIQRAQGHGCGAAS